MFIIVIAFVAGAILLQWQPTLPGVSLLLLIPPLLLGALKYRLIRIPGAVVLGFLWAALDAHLGLQSSLPPELHSRDILVTGTVSSLPARHDRRTAFEFVVDEVIYRDKLYPAPGSVKLNWYTDTEQIRAGDRWRLKVRLKPPHGFMNPAGFDYEGWLFHNGIRARGYVRDDPLNQRLGEGGLRFGLLRVRHHIGSVIDLQLQQGRASSLLKALVIGDRSGLNPAEWELFRRTGTNHLIAISGLHISIVGGLAYFLATVGWRLLPWLALRIAAPKAAAAAAQVAGTCYAALAGFSIPTQRALIMLTVVTLGIILQAQFKSLRSLGLALMIVVVLDPSAVLSPGFWLSFLAVTVIFIGVGYRTGRQHILVSLSRVQWFIGLGLVPVLLIWQQQVPLVAPLVNLLAVPLFSLLIIPISLGGTLLSLVWRDGGYVPLITADWLLDICRTLLTQAALFPLQISASPAIPLYLWVALVWGTLLLLLPRGIPGRIPGLVMLLPLILHSPVSTPEQGEFRFTLLDVGQGMAAVVQTRKHTLVFDAGPEYSPGFNAGSDILAPLLRARGINKIDRLILSNGDSDHRGGLNGLLGKMRVDSVLSGEPSRITEVAASFCSAGFSWSWDGVSFQLLHPAPDKNWRGNNASCVLRVENAAGSVLITGDIESAAEKRLVECCLDALTARLVTIPHHGSATSSSKRFLQAVDPDYALASTGFLNRYGFPKATVVSRWEAQGARVLDTALTGAIEFVFNPQLGIIGPDLHRLRARRYWTHRPETNGGSH